MPQDIRIRFGRAVRRIREEQKINQEEAAETLRAAPDVLQRNRARRQERVAGEYRENSQRVEEEPFGTVRSHLGHFVGPEIVNREFERAARCARVVPLYRAGQLRPALIGTCT